MTITDELRVIIEAQVEKAVKDMERWEQATESSTARLDAMQKAIDKTANRLMVFSAGLGGLAAAGIKSAAEFERQEKAFEVMLGSAEKARDVFKDLQKFSAKTPLQMGDINKAATDLLNYNVAQQDLVATMRMLGDAAQGRAEKLDTVVSAYGRMHLRGKATMEELNMLTQAGVPILARLAEQLGVTNDELFNMVSAGKVSFDDLNAAFVALTGEGGKLHNMMEVVSQTTEGKLSTAIDNLKLALADLAVKVLPTVNSMLDKISAWAEKFRNLDDGTKNLILTLVGIGVAAGPLAKVTSGALSAAAALGKLALANPVVLGIAAVTAAVVALGAAIALTRAKTVGFTEEIWKQGKIAALETARSYEAVKNTLPGMTRAMYDAAKATGNLQRAIEETGRAQTIRTRISMLENDVKTLAATYRREISTAIEMLNRPIDPQGRWFDNVFKSEEERFQAAQDVLQASIRDTNGVLRRNQEYWAAVKSGSAEAMKKALESVTIANPEIEKLKRDLAAIESGATITAASLSAAMSPPSTPEARKTWQAWFEEITGVSTAAIGTSGARAATLYLAGLEDELKMAQYVGDVLGKKIDPLPYLKSQAEAIKKTLTDLFSIDPLYIDNPFRAADNASVAMAARYQEITARIKEAEAAQKALNDRQADMDKARVLLDGLKTPYEHYADMHREIQRLQLAGALSTEQAMALNAQAYERYQQATIRAAEEIKNFHDLVSVGIREVLIEHLAVTREAAAVYGELAAQMVNLSINAAVDSFKELGKALQDGAISGEEFLDILGRQAAAILEQLPMLFVQAGLTAIAHGQLALGLGLIAAGLSGAVVSGFVSAHQEATKSAHGNIFEAGRLIAFAKGGAFTNTVVSTPTLFPMAHGTGLMGEAGAEAVVPLVRTASGDLGVRTSGGAGGDVYVIVHNYAGVPVETRENTNDAGDRTIELLIGEIVDRNLTTGRHDGALRGRYGTQVQGVR